MNRSRLQTWLSHPKSRWIAGSTAVAVLAFGLTVAVIEVRRDGADGRTARGDEELSAAHLPALESDAPPAVRPRIPTGDFSNGPSTAGKPAGLDTSHATIVGRDERTETWRDSKGLLWKRLWSGARNYKTAAGEWRPIDPDIVSANDGGWRNAADAADIRFKAATGQDDLVEIKKSGWSIGFALAGASPGRSGNAHGSRISFADVRPGMDLSYRVGPSSLKEEAILDAPPADGADVRLEFPLHLKALTARNEAGGISFYDQAGKFAARIPPGVMLDAHEAEHDVSVSLSGDDANPVIEVVASGAWLANASYPVRIDPSVNIGTADDTFVSSGAPTTNFGGWVYGRVGYYDASTGDSKTFMKFTLTSLAGQNITQARLRSYTRYATTYPAETGYYIRRVLGAWSSPNLTWNTKPAVSSTDYVYGTSSTYVWSDANVTSWVRNWLSGSWTNYGLALDMNSDPANFKRVSLAEELPGTTYDPYLEVGYGSVPNPATQASASPASGATVLTPTPHLSVAAVTDPDNDPVKYYFRIASDASGNSGQLVNSGWLTSPSWDPPLGSLADGGTYYWRVYTNDGSATTDSGWVNSFEVNLRLGAADVSPTDAVGASSINLATGNLSIDAASPSFPAVGGDAGVSFRYDSLAPPRRGLKGEYFADGNSNHVFDDGAAEVVRSDAMVDSSWGSGSPYPSISSDDFLVRWTGQVSVPTTGTWYFGAASDDGVKVYINNVLVVDRWFDQSYKTPYYGTSSTLTAGVKVPIKVEFYEDTGGATVQLAVKGPGVSDDTVVPADWLSPDDVGPLPTGWSLSAGDTDLAYERAIVTNDAVTLVGTDGGTSEYERKGTGFVPPAEEDGILTTDAATGNLLLRGDDGLIYTFRSDGALASAATTADDLAPAALQYTWSGTPPRLATITDPVSTRVITLTYQGGSCPTPPSGFDAAPPVSMLCKVAYWDGTQTNLFYASGQLARLEDPGAELTDLAYSSARLTKMRDALAADAIAASQRTDDDTTRTLISYDTSGRVSSVELPEPIAAAARPKHTFTYGSGQTDIDIAGMSGSAGYDRRVTFDPSGRVTTDKGPDGLGSTTAWDAAADRSTSETDAAGRMSTTLYDVEGRVTDTYGPAPSAWFGTDRKPLTAYLSQIAHESTAYDEGIASLAASYWANDTLTGQPTCHATGTGDAQDAVYKNWGTSSPSCLGSVVDHWSARYTGELLMPEAGTYTMRVYADGGARLWIDDALVTDSWGDALGWKDTSYSNVTANTRHRIRLEYWENTGNARVELHWIRPGGSSQAITGTHITPRYGLVTSKTTDDAQAGQQKTSTTYSVPHTGLVSVESVDPTGLNLQTQSSYETTGTGYKRRTQKVLPAGNAWTYAYYGATETLSSPPCGIPTTAKQAGLLRTETGPDPDGAGPGVSRTEEHAYDAAGREAATRIGSDDWTCTTFDERGRATSQTFPAFGGQSARTVTHNYVVGGNPLTTSISDAAGTITTTTDLLGRNTSYTDVWGDTTTTTYDQVSRVTRSQGPAGTQDFVFDDPGTQRLASQKLDGNTIAIPSYDSAGEMTSVSYPSGTGNGGNNTSLSSIGKDATGQTISLTFKKPDNSDLATDSVTRSQSGRITDETANGTDANPSGANFTYDGAGRLTDGYAPGRHASYTFASSGGCGSATAAGKNTNRTSEIIDGTTTISYCYDQADRLTSSTDPSYGTVAYDAHGNTTTLGNRTLTYDVVDRHVSTVLGGTTTINYLRDATDRLVERKKDGVTVARYGSSGDGDSPDFTLDATNAVIERTVLLPGGVLLTKRNSGDVWSYSNIHGDVVVTADGSGSPTASFSFDAFGVELAGTPDNSEGGYDYGWLGQRQRGLEHDGDNETIEMGSRQYVAALGRFIEVDPVDGGGANSYDYCVGDPIGCSDVEGTSGSHAFSDPNFGWCARHPWAAFNCLTAFGDFLWAWRWAARYFPGPGNIGKRNALRHCLWAASMAWSMGRRAAQGFLTRHEAGQHGHDHEVDLKNNRVGIAIGLSVHGHTGRAVARSIRRRCLCALRRGRLDATGGRHR